MALCSNVPNRPEMIASGSTCYRPSNPRFGLWRRRLRENRRRRLREKRRDDPCHKHADEHTVENETYQRESPQPLSTNKREHAKEETRNAEPEPDREPPLEPLKV